MDTLTSTTTQETTTGHIGRREITVEIRDTTYSNGSRQVAVWTPDTKKWARGISSYHLATIEDGVARLHDRDHCPKFARVAISNYTGMEVR